MKLLNNSDVSQVHGGAFITMLLEYIGKAYLMEAGKQVVAGTYYAAREASKYGYESPQQQPLGGLADFNIPASYVAVFGVGMAVGIAANKV